MNLLCNYVTIPMEILCPHCSACNAVGMKPAVLAKSSKTCVHVPYHIRIRIVTISVTCMGA